MSLVLEALKKLERDKQVEGRNGFLVMAARPWPSGEGRFLFVASLALAGIGLSALLAAGFWWWHHQQRTAATAAPSAALPAAPAVSHTATAPAPSTGPATAPAAVVAAPAASVAPPVHMIKDHPPASSAHGAEGDVPIATDAGSAKTSAVRLTAISERDGRPVAIVNDRMVYEGDSFDGLKILRIGENEVEVEVNGRKQVVKF